VVELRLQRSQAFTVDVNGLKDFPEQRLDALESLVDRAFGSDAIPEGLAGGARRVFGS
jgi:hypothetical protein